MAREPEPFKGHRKLSLFLMPIEHESVTINEIIAALGVVSSKNSLRNALRLLGWKRKGIISRQWVRIKQPERWL